MDATDIRSRLANEAPGVGAVLIIVISLLLYLSVPLPARQSDEYHRLADDGTTISNRWENVYSNIGFLAAGVLGVWVVFRYRSTAFCSDLRVRHGAAVPYTDRQEILAPLVLFAGACLTAFGSAYYHLNPRNDTLVWDRLSMTVAFSGLLAMQASERLGKRIGTKLLGPLIVIGAGTVWYWSIFGDLHPYSFFQLYVVAGTLLMIGFFPATYTRTGYVLGALGCYALAKIFEDLDHPIHRWTSGIVGGHPLKHLVAAAGVLLLAIMLTKRVAKGPGMVDAGTP